MLRSSPTLLQPMPLAVAPVPGVANKNAFQALSDAEERARDAAATMQLIGLPALVFGERGTVLAANHFARSLTAGKTLDDIAASSGVSRNTVRTQLRGVLEKTGCVRQAEVVALLSGITRAAVSP